MPKGNVNIVHDEQIWRDHIRTETNTLKTWESKWGFTKDMYKEMYSQEEETTEARERANPGTSRSTSSGSSTLGVPQQGQEAQRWGNRGEDEE